MTVYRTTTSYCPIHQSGGGDVGGEWERWIGKEVGESKESQLNGCEKGVVGGGLEGEEGG